MCHCFIVICFPKCNSAKGKNLPNSFQTQAYINILVDIRAAFSLSVAYMWLEVDWKYTTSSNTMQEGGWHKRGENAASEFTCLHWQSCQPGSLGWRGGYFTIPAGTTMPTNLWSPILGSNYFGSGKQAKRKEKEKNWGLLPKTLWKHYKRW